MLTGDRVEILPGGLRRLELRAHCGVDLGQGGVRGEPGPAAPLGQDLILQEISCCVSQHALHPVSNVTTQLGLHHTGMDRIHEDALVLHSLCQLLSEQDVCQLGLAVGLGSVVGGLCVHRLDGGQDPLRVAVVVGGAAYGDDGGHTCLLRRRLKLGQQQVGQQLVPKMVGPNLSLQPILGEPKRRHHDAGVQHQAVDGRVRLCSFLGEAADRCEGRQVHQPNLHLLPGQLLNGAGRLIALALRAAGGYHRRPPLRQVVRSPVPQPRVGPGDDNGLPGEVRDLLVGEAPGGILVHGGEHSSPEGAARSVVPI
mmetsp:Transcript_29647/g.67161  ORF Transcript_29647/g.67161 Transcript_29647/m.67161 type:complete len:311 (-) Transcript_29647:162-1094(-)